VAQQQFLSPRKKGKGNTARVTPPDQLAAVLTDDVWWLLKHNLDHGDVTSWKTYMTPEGAWHALARATWR
jgi:hypothetical protein